MQENVKVQALLLELFDRVNTLEPQAKEAEALRRACARYEKEIAGLKKECAAWSEVFKDHNNTLNSLHKNIRAISEINSLYMCSLRSLPAEIQNMFWKSCRNLEARQEANNAANMSYLSPALAS